MLKQIKLKNFTVFEEAEFNFGPGLNVVIGGNGTGKTHLLKVGHCLLNSIEKFKDDKLKDDYRFFTHLFVLNTELHFNTGNDADLFRNGKDLGFNIITDYFSMDNITDIKYPTTSIIKAYYNNDKKSILVPPKEVFTLSSWLPGINKKFNLEIDQSYPDLLTHLSLPTLKEQPYPKVINEIEQIIGGQITKEGDRFYVIQSDGKRIVSNLMAEGHRKLAMIAYLLKNGSLNKDITLFWDEPEANLNPTLIRKLASILTILATNGFQIVLATHSLFLMKELHLLSKEAKPVHYIGLIKENDSVRVTEAEDLDELELIESLEAELDQSIRYLNS